MGSYSKILGFGLIGLLLVGCGVGSARRSSSTATATSVDLTDFTVSSFSPPSGDVTGVPTSIAVTFNQTTLGADAANLNYYNLSCAGDVYGATAVDHLAGTNFVVVSLPPVSGLSAGTPCYFSISPYVTNEAGYSTIGARSAVYYLLNGV